MLDMTGGNSKGLGQAGYLEHTSSAEPHVIFARQLLHTIAGLVHRDAAHIAAHQLILVIVHIAVTHCAAVASPAHLQPGSRASWAASTLDAHFKHSPALLKGCRNLVHIHSPALLKGCKTLVHIHSTAVLKGCSVLVHIPCRVCLKGLVTLGTQVVM